MSRPQWSSFRSVRGEALSQDDVAALCGVTRQAVQQAEHDGLAKLRPLCVARGLAPGSILAGWPCGVEPLVGRYLGPNRGLDSRPGRYLGTPARRTPKAAIRIPTRAP